MKKVHFFKQVGKTQVLQGFKNNFSETASESVYIKSSAYASTKGLGKKSTYNWSRSSIGKQIHITPTYTYVYFFHIQLMLCLIKYGYSSIKCQLSSVTKH